MTARLRTILGVGDIAQAGITTVSDEADLPPCHGMSWLFDSREVSDHLIARNYCRECPLLDECRQAFLTARRLASAVNRHSGPEGTWAGRLYNAASQPVRVPQPRRCLTCDQPMVKSRATVIKPRNYVYHQAKGYCATCYPRRPK
jgi:hypothetical protein